MTYVGEIAGVGTAMCWTVSALSFEAAGRRIGSVTVNFIRLVMAWGMLAVWGLLSARHMAVPCDASAERWMWLSLSGFVGFFLGDLCVFRSFVMIGPRLSMLVFTLAPPMTALLGWIFLGESLTSLNMVGMALTLAGISWVVAEGKVHSTVKQWKPSTWGILLAFLGAVGQAVANILAKKGLIGYDKFAATQIRVTAALPAFALLFLAMRWYPRAVRGARDARAMAQTAVGSFFGPVLGVSLLLLSMQYLATGISQTFASAATVAIIPLTMLIYKEHVSLRAVLGAAVAVAGVAILFIKPG